MVVSIAPPGDRPREATASDESRSGPDEVRRAYDEVIATLSERGLRKSADAVAEETARRGVEFGAGGARRPFRFDPVPRIVSEVEWRLIAAGTRQRLSALNEFVRDAYGARRIVAAGVVPARALDSSRGWEPAMEGLLAEVMAPITAAGFDLARDGGGDLVVLEDNLRMPSGMLYMRAAREVLGAALELDAPGPDPDPVPMLGAALRAAAPGVDDPRVALLADAGGRDAWWEHGLIAGELGIPIVSPADLAVRRKRLILRDEGPAGKPLDVVYRRTDDDALTGPDGAPTPLGELLIEPLRAGTLRCANAFGAALADDKLTHAYVEAMIDFYLGEAPILRSARSHDLGDPETRERALERIGELVVKPRDGLGGHGVLIGQRASAAELATARARVEADPRAWVAQETIAISTCPTVSGSELVERHVDLRPFALSAPEPRSIPGALTRVAFDAGEMVVNSSRNGGGKDTWITTEPSGTDGGR